MKRRARHSCSSRSARASLLAERLEQRAMLAADLGSAVRQLVWNGAPVTTRADAWIVRADTPAVAVRAGWTAAPLGQGFFSVTAPGVSAAEVGNWATSTAGVRYVEPDAVITTSATPNDPSLRQLWGMNNTSQTGGVADADIDAPEAWDVSTGSRSVVVAVIDTGIDYRHSDLAANMWRNPGEVAGDGIDNDGNGFADDVYGWDFANNDADPFDDQGHGTHVAGTIGAVGNNGIGVAGVNWQVSMMGLKFLGADGSGSTSAAIAAINYATRMRRDFGINVVATNNSWGGGGPSAALRDAIAAGEGVGILCVAAAGNEATNNDATASYPSGYASISVAATDSSNRLASFSNYGATTVDVAAPGAGILSTTPNNTYSTYSGTSMATPHVAGLVALLAAANPQATSAEIRSAVLSTAVPVSNLAGKVATGGLINARAALNAITAIAPPAPPEPPAPPPAPAPTADVIDVSPDPRTTAVSGVVVQFSAAVSGFDVADLSLTRDGAAVSLGGVTLSTTDNVRWTIDGLTNATTTEGTYVLTVSAAGSGITSVDGGVALAASAADEWVTRAPALVDAGDTMSSAAVVSVTSGELRLSGRIGDGTAGARDVDMYRVRLSAGQSFVIDIDAQSLAGGSTLDSYVRLFDGSGRQIARNDDSGGSLDSYLSYRAAAAGTFYVGISGYRNTSYSPSRLGWGRNGSTGVYSVRFAFSSTAGGRMTASGSRDAGALTAAHSAFAAYGANWMAALPAAPGGQRARRTCG